MIRILLRRTKQMKDKDGKVLLPLPSKQVVWHKVQFSEREAQAYKILVDLLRANFNKKVQ